MAQLPRAVVVGSLNADMIVRTARVPAAGETFTAQSFQTGSGGKGANQATAIARLSRTKNDLQAGAVTVIMAGAVGNDQFGRDSSQSLQENGVDVEHVAVRHDQITGIALVIIDDESGDNRILLSPNANASVRPDEFPVFEPPFPDLLVLQLEVPVETILAILVKAARHNVPVLFNPAPAQVLPRETYRAVTYLVVNESEAAILTGNADRTIDWLHDGPERDKLLELGAPHTIVTLGSEGGFYACQSGGEVQTHQWKSLSVPVRDTAAAGDTFVGALTVAIARDRKPGFEQIVRAIAWANEAASITVQRDGAAAAIPWMDEVTPLEAVRPE